MGVMTTVEVHGGRGRARTARRRPGATAPGERRASAALAGPGVDEVLEAQDEERASGS